MREKPQRNANYAYLCATCFEQAVDAYRNALQVRLEDAFPADWSQTTANLAMTYEMQRDWSAARRCYEQLLVHEPGNMDLKAKLRELSSKH